MGERSFVEVSGGRIEVDVTPGDDRLPELVFLHEGLGSIDLWRGFPDVVARRLGGPATIVYSRHGYGRSAPAVRPRPVGYMHHEADVVLPELLAALRVSRPVLVGHSDGASIALLHAGDRHPVAALVCLAPHVFVEPESVAGVASARESFEAGDLARRMVAYHDDPAATFAGWHDAWASDEFRSWNIEDRLPGITAPVLVVQGLRDQYGTVEQVERIAAGVAGRVERLVIDGAGHAPHLDERELVVEAIGAFLSAG